MKKLKSISIFVIILMITLVVGCSQQEKDSRLTSGNGVRIPVVMYHHLSNDVANIGIVSPDKFKEDLKTYKEAGYTPILFKDLIKALNDKTKLPDKPMIITFDDGYQSNYDIAYPILKELDMKAVISVIGWSVGRTTFIDSDKPITPHFSWEQAKEMVDSGLIEIQNHTFDLHSEPGKSFGYNMDVGRGVEPLKDESYEVYSDRVKKDLIENNQLIEKAVGIAPTVITYPYGWYSEQSENIINEIGFLGSITTKEGVRTYKTIEDIKLIPRYNITEQIKGEKLINLIKQ